MTWPAPRRKLNGSLRVRELSNGCALGVGCRRVVEPAAVVHGHLLAGGRFGAAAHLLVCFAISHAQSSLLSPVSHLNIRSSAAYRFHSDEPVPVAIRRGVLFVLVLIGMAIVVSVAGIALLFAVVSRGPAVPSTATLVLRPGGEIAGGRRPTTSSASCSAASRRPCAASSTAWRKAKRDRAHHQRAAGAVHARPAVLGQAAGAARRRARLPRSRASRSSRSSSTAAIASTTWPARPTGSSCCRPVRST